MKCSPVRRTDAGKSCCKWRREPISIASSSQTSVRSHLVAARCVELRSATSSRELATCWRSQSIKRLHATRCPSAYAWAGLSYDGPPNLTVYGWQCTASTRRRQQPGDFVGSVNGRRRPATSRRDCRLVERRDYFQEPGWRHLHVEPGCGTTVWVLGSGGRRAADYDHYSR